MAQVPISGRVMDEEWVEQWVGGNSCIDMELHNALIEKSDTFDPIKDIDVIRQIINKHMSANPSKAPGVSVAQEQLQVDQFALMMKQLEYDKRVGQVWKDKCTTVMGARRFSEMEAKMSFQNALEEHAETVMGAWCEICVWEDSNRAIGEVMTFKRAKILTKVGGSCEEIANVPFLNWSAPCMVSAKQQDDQATVLTWALQDQMQSAAVVVGPVFTYHKGRLHLEETKVLAQLSKGNHNLDYTFSLTYTEQTDTRDERPMVYPGRCTKLK